MDRPAGFKDAVCKLVDGYAEFSWPDYPNFPSIKIKNRYGQKGDIFWVRETFCKSLDVPGEYYYKASNPEVCTEDCDGSPWKPSIHMPKDAARIWLKRTGTRIERLGDISEEDAIAEGIHREWDGTAYWYKNYLDTFPSNFKGVPKRSFQSLWNSINGPESWDANPWVWVLEFERIEKP